MSASEHNLGGLPISVGDVLLKKYRVEGLIAEGGTGVVLAATHVQLERRVAIKFLRQALADDEVRTRFEREARAIGKIESEHVVIMLDAGSLPDGAPYMVMEHLEGRDLARIIKEDGPLPMEEAVDCMMQVCEALAQAHDNGIIHRDLKPANLFLTKRGDDEHVHIKVVDFGISKILDKSLLADKPEDVTSAFTVLGSPRWMAPEQLRDSKAVDHRADLWSIGAVLFQLLTGEHAFAAEGNVQAAVAVMTAEPRRLRELVPTAPAGLEAVISKCLKKDEDERYQSAHELAEALRPFASERAVDSLDRLETAKLEPNLRIAVGISAASTPPPRTDPGPGSLTLSAGARDATTERRIKIRDEPPTAASRTVEVASEREVSSSRAPRSKSSSAVKLVLLTLGTGVLTLVVGEVALTKGVRRSDSANLVDSEGRSHGSNSPANTAHWSASAAPPPTASAPSQETPRPVPLDAGHRDP